MSKKKSAQHKQPPAANPQRLSLLLRGRWPAALPAAALLLMSILSYWPAYFAGFVWDDKVFLDAPPIVAMSGLADIWFTPGSLEFEGHYWPLVYTTFWLEHKLWGFNPTAFHIINVLLHGAVTLLIWRLLARLSVPGAWLAAAIFAVHPVHVEAVAWVIARKDLLAAFFYLLAAGCWLRFKDEPKTGAYLLMLALFTAGMLSKSFVITLPANLLVWAWWKQGRIAGKDLMQLAPMLLLGIAITLYDFSQYTARAGIDYEYSFMERLTTAATALWFYASKLLWPHPLLAIYPKWDINLTNLLTWLPLLAAVTLALALWLARHRIGRGALAGALFFAITLSPMLGFADNVFTQFSYVADRYQYFASAGLIAVLAAVATVLCRRLPLVLLHGARALAALLLLGYSALTWQQARTYQDEIVFFKHVVAHNPVAYHANFNLGNALREAGRMEEALAAYEIAVEQDPDSTEIIINLGVAWLENEDYQAAEQSFRRAVQLEPHNFQAQQNLAAALRRQARYEESLATMQTAARLIPDPPAQHYYYMAMDAIELSKTDQAQNYLSRALSIDPTHEAAREQLAFLHMNAGRYDQALATNPALLQTLDVLAYNHYNAGRVEEALELYRHHVAMAPKDANPHANLGSALAQLGRYQEAIAILEQALKLDPNHQTAQASLKLLRERFPQGLRQP